MSRTWTRVKCSPSHPTLIVGSAPIVEERRVRRRTGDLGESLEESVSSQQTGEASPVLDSGSVPDDASM